MSTAQNVPAGRPRRRSPRTVAAALLVLVALALLFGVVGATHPDQGGGDQPTGAPALGTATPPPLAPVALAPVLDAPGRQACTDFAYWVADKGPVGLVLLPADEWAAVAGGYRTAVRGTTNGLLRESADVLDRVTNASKGARELARDTVLARCEGAGWVAP